MGRLHEYDWIEQEEERPRSGGWTVVLFWLGYGAVMGMLVTIGVLGGAHYVGEQIKHWFR